MIKRLLIPIFVFLFVTTPAMAGEVNVKKLHKTEWIQLETDNFRIITDAGEKKAAAMAEELERFRFFIALLLGYSQNPLPVKVPVILAKSSGTYRALGIPQEYVGVFTTNESGEFTIFANAKGFKNASSGRGNMGRAVVLHELVHLLIKNSSLKFATPPWYNEGIAEYFATYMEKKDQIILGDVSVVKNRFYSMIDHMGNPESVETENLFKTTQSDLNITDNPSSEQGKFLDKFYARSFAVIHYLNADPEREKQLFTYLHLIKKGYSVDETFKYVFKKDFVDLDKEVDDYIKRRYMMGRVFPMNVQGGVNFPDFPHTRSTLEPRDALPLLVSRIASFSIGFLGEGNRDKMLSDAKAIYPELF